MVKMLFLISEIGGSNPFTGHDQVSSYDTSTGYSRLWTKRVIINNENLIEKRFKLRNEPVTKLIWSSDNIFL